MRVCQFRHYGTVPFAPLTDKPEHAYREPLVLQTEPLLSIPPPPLQDIAAAAFGR
jgi:hypothetical protein